MNLKITRPINREAWLEALHAKGSVDESLRLQMDQGEKLLIEVARPKAVYKIVERADICIKRGNASAKNADGYAESFSIKKHLEGCHKVILMAVTLGAGVEQLLRKTQITDMAMAVIIDCGASVLVDQLADEFQEYITGQVSQQAAEMEEGPTYTTSRFSPGYGDYPITEQARIVRQLDGQRQIGLSVTKDSLMIPRKSITALIGIADHPVTGTLATCGECVLRDKCTLKKEGKFCGDKL